MSTEPVWTRRIADEFWSGPVSPLTFSLLAEPMVEHMVRRPLRLASLPGLARLPVLRLHASHVYANAALLAAVIELLPPVLETDGVRALVPGNLLPPRRPPWHGALRAAAIGGRFWLREADWAPWRRAAAFDQTCAAVRARFAGAAPPSPDRGARDLMHELAEARRALGSYLGVVSWVVVFAYVFYHLLDTVTRRWAPGLTEERAALTVGLTGVASLDAHREVVALGEGLAREPDLGRLAPDAVAARLAAHAGPLGDRFRALLARHGHRLSGRDLSCPTWREAPVLVVQLARSGARESASAVAGAPARRADAIAAVERRVRAGLAGPARAAAFRLTLGFAQRYYVARENMRYHADYFLARLRLLALAVGERLVREGRLAAASDVCFLDYTELMQMAAGRDAVAPPALDERRTAFARDAATPPAVLLDGPPAAIPAGAPPTLAGEPGAPGACRARARLVRGPDDFARVADGDVVVAPYTDPGWTPLLERAAGLVLEAGGPLSHGAIVARELGIPALVNVAGAMRSIVDGATVELDAASGVITLVAGE